MHNGNHRFDWHRTECDIREALVRRLRYEILSGIYETNDKLAIAAERLLIDVASGRQKTSVAAEAGRRP